ncbi:MAG: hypothetical protein FWF86_00235 [Clostridia bacterium]|nr:hypothetical protein [Clostridia bacterium]
MPSLEAYRRSPLGNPAFTPLNDAAVQDGGLLHAMNRQVLGMADIQAMSPLDAVLASKLGGYTDLPPLPDVEVAAEGLDRADPRVFLSLARAALMTASASRDKSAMLRLLSAMRTFQETMPSLPEDALFTAGADALRVTDELYRRTGQPFLLTLLEGLRYQLPDVAGMLHSFPFLKAYQRPQDPGGNAEYHRRMELLATGSLTADTIAMTALLALYSGSGRDAAAPKAGLANLKRYHGAPAGAFLADPYLAGRDPARATDLPALCSLAEALADVLMASGDLTAAEQLEMLLANALPDMIGDRGIRSLQPVNRLPGDESCVLLPPTPAETAWLLRALYALRRSVWTVREADEIALLLPVSGGCVTRIGGAPLRIRCKAEGLFRRTLTLTVETKQPVLFTLLLRVPHYALDASVTPDGGKKTRPVPAGALLPLRGTYQEGSAVTLRYACVPRAETGYRGSQSVFCGPTLMALSLPDPEDGWQYALTVAGEDAAPILSSGEKDGVPLVYARACGAPGWQAKNGFITPPPQGLPVTTEYELTLLPYAGTEGRIAAFPRGGGR